MAANPQMVIRVAATVDQLRKNLAEGKANIEALSASVEKYSKDWTKHSAKLQQDAHNIVAAVNQVGAATLTTGDASRALKQLDAAMQQLRIAGQPIPPLMQQTADRLRELHPAATQGGTALGTLKDMAGQLGIVFGAGAIAMGLKAIVMETFAFADNLVRVSDRIGETIGGVQRLGFVASQSGNNIDEVAAAIGAMQDKLAGGDKSAVSALQKLNLSLDELRDASPEQAVIAISEAMRSVGNATDRAQIATDLFGKAGRAILPTLMADYKKLAESATYASDAQIRKLDELGDAWAAFKLRVRIAVAELITGSGSGASSSDLDSHNQTAQINAAAQRASEQAMASLDKTVAALVKARQQAWNPAGAPAMAPEALATLAQAGPAGTAAKAAITDGNKLADSYDRMAEAAKNAGAAISAAESAEAKARSSWLQGIAAREEILEYQNTLAMSFKSLAEFNDQLMGEFSKGLERVDGPLQQLIVKSERLFAGNVKIEEGATDWKKWGETSTFALNQMSRAAEMAGNATVSALASIGAAITGTAVASKGNPWAIAAAGVSATLGAFGNLLFKTESRQVNDLRDTFISVQGGFAQLHATLYKVGSEAAFLSLLNAKNTKEWEAALLKVNTILQKNADLEALRKSAIPTWETISALAAKYGIDVERAGQAVQQLMINANAQAAINDWQQWVKANGDLDVFAKAAAASFSTLVQQAMQFGVMLPENMRPMLESLVSQGLLLDKNGKKIADIAGLTFGAAVQTETERLAAAIETLVDELRALRGLPPVVINSGLNQVVAAQSARMQNVEYAGGQARGGDYVVTRPTMFLAGEAGPERATFTPAGAGIGGSVTVVIQAWDGPSVDTWLRSGGGRKIADAIVPHFGKRVNFRIGS